MQREGVQLTNITKRHPYEAVTVIVKSWFAR